ncbi:DUF427 domain-containing protein [Frankia gtarii]|uniref:DUF427 domain-containing protein n=1 Tax=Frankia gtarii TaxID=2950102 RepID=UPI0021C150BA|nr:DUF427 domain-containing protein [Frankia gtarii]
MTTQQARGRVRLEQGRKRVRAYLGGRLVVDTTSPALVWENPHYPAYYLPRADVVAELVPTDRTEHSPSRGDAVYFDVVVEGRTAPAAAWAYPQSPLEGLRELVRLDWEAMDRWLEEDEPVYVHPRSPYTRIDALPSSRHVRVEIDGVLVADSHRPVILFETGLVPRYYLPLVDVRQDLLRPSDTRTRCPYKGNAEYFSVEVDGTRHDDVVWTYRTPLPESARIAGLVCFYDERVAVSVDGASTHP